MATMKAIVPAKTQVAKVTSKGQVTIPVEIRRILGAKTGDRLVFEPTQGGIRIARENKKDAFEQYRGIGNGIPELDGGRESINRYMREMRGHDEVDDLIFGTEG